MADLFALGSAVALLLVGEAGADCQRFPESHLQISSFSTVHCTGTPDTDGVSAAATDVTIIVFDDGIVDVAGPRAISLGDRMDLTVQSGGLVRSVDARAVSAGIRSTMVVQSGATVELNKTPATGSEVAVFLGAQSTVIVEEGGLVRVTNTGAATSDALFLGGDITVAGVASTTGNFTDAIDIGSGTVVIEETGVVTTNGINSDGIDADNFVTSVTVRGDITVSGARSTGVQLGNGTMVTVEASGSVTAEAADGLAISASFNAVIENAGSLSSAGVAIQGGGGVEQLTNTGTVTGDVLLSGGDDSLSHDADTGSLSGVVDGGAGTDAFNLIGGSFDLTLPLNFELASIGNGAIGTGDGAFGGGLTVQAGGTAAPGASIGTLTLAGDLIVEAGGMLALEVDADALDADLVVVDGTATIDGDLLESLFAGAAGSLIGSTFNLVEATGGLAGATVAALDGTTTASAIAGLDVTFDVVDASTVASTIVSGEVLQATFSQGASGCGVCGDPVDPPPSLGASATRVITASDALFVLRTAVGQVACALCVCDVNDSGAVSATDALLVLQTAVGQPVVLDCP